MSKTLSFAYESPQEVKVGDDETTFTLICKNEDRAVDLTGSQSIIAKIGNQSGYLRGQPINLDSPSDLHAGQISLTFEKSTLDNFPPGLYSLEIWVIDSNGTSIYPSDNPLSFTVTSNLESGSGTTITTIAFDDFVKAMNKAASTIAKGDPGEGLNIKGQVTSVSALPTTANEGNGYLVNEELYVYTSGAWKDCGTIQGPQGIQGKAGTGISSTTIQYQISNSATTAPTGTWSNDIVATTTANPYLWMKATLNYTDNTTKDFYLISQKGDKGDKGDTPDLSNYTTVTDLNNGLSTKVTDNKNGTIEVNGSSITPADDSKVLHSALTQLSSADMNTVATAGFYQLNSGTNGMPNADAWTIYQVIPLSSFNGVQLACETNKTVLGMRSWNYSNGARNFSNWIQFADDSKVLHLSTGDTASRPTGISTGYQYFDTSLNKPIWYTGKNWVDATGTTV
ncbi:hypothetical protein [Lactiplantibacillus plantarum]|uniref:hypothetical protein n=1 Tax=Lactiplantibacillus plantarum TaxID=1590 RepID=UPI0021821694|nr:hypothetical protein [Lactiplantibacillus plantarum]MCT0193858.1 hypothetical protein [Lactiplantibacillus plantarum]